eukprot:scaffold399_cov112-Isochrysis_galbana.AAC.2
MNITSELSRISAAHSGSGCVSSADANPALPPVPPATPPPKPPAPSSPPASFPSSPGPSLPVPPGRVSTPAAVAAAADESIRTREALGLTPRSACSMRERRPPLALASDRSRRSAAVPMKTKARTMSATKPMTALVRELPPRGFRPLACGSSIAQPSTARPIWQSRRSYIWIASTLRSRPPDRGPSWSVPAGRHQGRRRQQARVLTDRLLHPMPRRSWQHQRRSRRNTSDSSRRFRNGQRTGRALTVVAGAANM